MDAARFSLRDRPLAVHWLGLIVLSGLCVGAFSLLRLSAALLLGSMLAGILIAVADGRARVPLWPYRLAQGVIGCMIARSLNAGILQEMLAHGAVFATCITSVIVVSILLGGLLARMRVLPGSTAVWGSAPGAASAMALMAEAFGGDVRLVAFMQYTRVVLVALTASLVARVWLGHAGAAPAITWFPALPLGPFALTLLIACGGAVLGAVLNIPAGSLLVPMVLTIALNVTHLAPITLPQWLLAISYALLGWSFGLRFTREIVGYAARAFPRIFAAILTLIALCGMLAYVLHRITGADALTAYLATSPGGADSVAIIAATTKVDVPFVMAMQTGRFLLVLLIGPSVAKWVARWAVTD